MRWESRTFWSKIWNAGAALGNSIASGSNVPNAFGKSLYGRASLANRLPFAFTTIDDGAPRPHSNCGTSSPSRVMSGTNITGVPQYDVRLASLAPTSLAIVRPSPTLFGGLNGFTS